MSERDKKAAGVAAPKKNFNFKNPDLIYVGIFFAVTTVIFSSFIFSDNLMVSSDQLTGIDMAQTMTDGLFNHGQIPTWFSSRLGGMPSIDAKFSDALYPVTLLMRPFMPAYRLFGFVMVFHVFLAGVFFFFMLRKSFSASRLAAFAGSLFYMLSPQFVSHVNPGHDGKMCVIAWLPFVVWRLRSLLGLPTLLNACFLALGIGMMILTPHTQMAYFVLMGLFLYWVTDLVTAVLDKAEKKRVVSKVVFFWVAVFLGLGMSFMVLFPSYMYVREAFSVRGIDRGFEFAASWSMNWAEFFSLWVHEFGNALEYYWGPNFFKLNTEYAGAVPFLLTFLALASKPKSLWRIFWASIAVLAVLFAMGANTPFFTAAYHLVPGIKRFRAPSMIMFWFTFSTALMAFFFIKDLLAKRFEIQGEQQRKWAAGLMAALGSVTLITLAFSVESFVTGFAASMMGGGNAPQVFEINFKQKFVPNLWFWWLMSVVTLGMLLAVVKGKLKAATLVYALIAMSTVDMIKVNNQFIKVDSPARYFFQNEPTLVELRREFAGTPFRVFPLSGTFPMQNQEGVYGLESVTGYHDNELNCYRAFRGDQRDLNYLLDIAEISPGGQMRLSMAKIAGNKPFLDLANVAYILMGTETGGISKIENRTNLGRLSYAADFVVIPEERLIDALRTRGYDYRTTVALLEEPELPFTAGAAASRQPDAASRFRAEWKKYTPNVRVAAVTMPADGFLRLSEVYYPGWRIKIDGAPVKYYRSDMAWIAVPLKAGNYEVTMEPRSLYLDGSLWVSSIFTLITAAILAYYGISRRRRAAAPIG
ncbi:MAG: hypothetical protein LBC70_09680 [Chitinispirillales bacterium]|nr:hypothetical protein [Chitinispirillales bacterium]